MLDGGSCSLVQVFKEPFAYEAEAKAASPSSGLTPERGAADRTVSLVSVVTQMSQAQQLHRLGVFCVCRNRHTYPRSYTVSTLAAAPIPRRQF